MELRVSSERSKIWIIDSIQSPVSGSPLLAPVSPARHPLSKRNTPRERPPSQATRQGSAVMAQQHCRPLSFALCHYSGDSRPGFCCGFLVKDTAASVHLAKPINDRHARRTKQRNENQRVTDGRLWTTGSSPIGLSHPALINQPSRRFK